jgi:hypothetical protein
MIKLLNCQKRKNLKRLMSIGKVFSAKLPMTIYAMTVAAALLYLGYLGWCKSNKNIQILYPRRISVTYVSAIERCFHWLLNKMFVFTSTFKLFGAETRLAEMRQASKISPCVALPEVTKVSIATAPIDVFAKNFVNVKTAEWNDLKILLRHLVSSLSHTHVS